MNGPRTAAALGILLALGGCVDGGGGSDPSPFLPLGETRGACNAALERAWMGDYEGRVTLDETARGGPFCVWDVRLSLRTVDQGVRCPIAGVVTTIVSQPVAPSPDSASAAECRDGVERLAAETVGIDGVRWRAVPLGSTAESFGPYFGDPSAIVRYVHPFSGRAPLVDVFERRFDGALDVREIDPVSGRDVFGTLVPVSDF